MTSMLDYQNVNDHSWIDNQLQALVHRFRDVLALRPAALKCFVDQGIQVEGWFKGELLTFLAAEKHAERIVGFDREVLNQLGKSKTDLTIDLCEDTKSCKVWIELKHYLIGIQKGIDYTAYGYFNDPCNGIKPDVDKLIAMAQQHKFVLILATVNPNSTNWNVALARFQKKFAISLHPLTDANDFPPEFFLGLMAVDRLPQAEATILISQCDSPQIDKLP